MAAILNSFPLNALWFSPTVMSPPRTEWSLREGSEKRCSFPRSCQHRSFWKNGSTGTRIIEGWALGKLIPSSHLSNKTDQTSNSDKLSGFSAWTWLTPLPKGPSQSSALRHHPPPLGAQPGQLGCLLCPADNVWLKAGEAARCLRRHARPRCQWRYVPPFFAGKQLLRQDRGPVVDFQISVHRDSWIFLLMKTVLTKSRSLELGDMPRFWYKLLVTFGNFW